MIKKGPVQQIYTFLLGTAVLLDVSKEAGVRHFIYCSSMSAVIGHCGINEGTEESTVFQDRPLHYGYAISKQKAETMVLERNCKYHIYISIFNCDKDCFLKG